MLLVAENKTGYFGVYENNPGGPNPCYLARVRRCGKLVSLGTFATAEEAALSVARSPEGQKAAQKTAAAPPLTSEQAQQQARAEGLTLIVAENTTGYFGVHHHATGHNLKPFQVQFKRGGKDVYLGTFATAEEAALCVARSPEGRAAAKAITTPPVPPLTSEQARQQAQAEGLTLIVAENTTGYWGVIYRASPSKPYEAQVYRGGKHVYFGRFVTAEEAALCLARTPEGQAAAADRAAAKAPLTSEEARVTSEEARQQAQAQGLTLRAAENKTGYFGVYLKPGSHGTRPKPYRAELWSAGKTVTLGSFTTAEGAALCVARSPEGQAAAKRAAAAAPVPLTSEEAQQQAQAQRLTLRVTDNKTSYFGVSRDKPGKTKPRGKKVSLGCFATTEEAARSVVRSPKGQAAARRTAAPPLASKEAQQQARDAIIGAAALDIIYEAAGAAAAELSAEVAAEVMAGIAMGL